jgi:glycosyltransferase involved in cell wall biosynthesis
MAKDFKVLQFSNNLEVRLGGPPMVVLGIQSHLNAEFDHQLVIFGKSDFVLPNSTNIPTVKNNHYGFFWGILPKAIRRLITEADLLIMHEFYLYSNLWVIFLAKNKKVLMMPHGTFEIYQQQRSRIKKFVFDFIFKLVSRNCEISFIVATASEKMGVSSKFPRLSISTVGIGVSTPKDLVRKTSSNHELLCLSRIAEKKRIDICIESISLLQTMGSKHYSLSIAGEGDDTLKNQLVNYAEKLGVSSSVNFLGLLLEEEKWKAIENSSILLLPSMNENFAISVAECISAGVPVIVSKNVALHAFVEKHKCGIVVSDISDKELVKAIKEIENEFSIFVSNCNLAAPELSWESIGRKWVDVINDFLSIK